jgi:hypothetical protein
VRTRSRREWSKRDPGHHAGWSLALEPCIVDAMTAEWSEAQAVELLATERDQCVQGVIEFMAACGVRTTTVPPQLLELLTLYGLTAIDIGKELAHRKATLDERPDSGLLQRAHGSERRRRPSAEITQKVLLASQR